MRLIRKIYNLFFSSRKVFVRKLRRLLGFIPTNVYIFQLAFKHSSKSDEPHTSNERLEFLGDAVLDSVVSEYLFKRYPLRGEGFLTEMRSKIVNRKRMGDMGESIGLHDFLDYNATYVSVNSTILGNALEAVIGAIYMDAGYASAKKFILNKLIYPYINLDELQKGDINYKSRLFEWAQKYERNLEFTVLEEKVEKNIRMFFIGAFVSKTDQAVRR